MTKYLVLGSNSFAGSNVVKLLLSRGDAVVGASRSKEPHPTLLAYHGHPEQGRFSFHPLDLNQHSAELFELISREKPNVIVDLAGQGMVAESWQTPEEWYQTNIVSKVKLHNFLRQCDFLDRYVRVSTPEVYGHQDHFVTEGQSFNPSTPYAVSHAAIDMSLMAFHRQYQFPVIFTRFANFYGPHQQLYRIIPRTILFSLMGKKLSLHGGGKSKRAFIHGQDVAEALVLSAEKGRTGESYHFSTGEPISIAELVRAICERMQVDFESFTETAPDRPGKDAQYAMDITKVRTELGWKPKIELSQGLAETIDWIRRDFETIQSLPLNYVHKA
ncbi:MAG: NAD-dependent epimerase/dehydratase family protein [Gammaproteobacteria bacterium]|nr:NAD-dependent epimerase/dehydratase family protein [Gammaproteobacteria bacterium]